VESIPGLHKSLKIPALLVLSTSVTSTTYPVEKGGPPLHGDALENSQHGVQNVVKRRYAKIGTLKEKRKLINCMKVKTL
jgi:hypothetical protein